MSSPRAADTRRTVVTALSCSAILQIAGSWLVFVLARRFQWNLGWTYAGLLAALAAVSTLIVHLANPDLLRRRLFARPGTKSWDLVCVTALKILWVAVYLTAAWEARLRTWDPGSPGVGWLIGAAILVAGWTLLTWSMVANPFFEQTVRIQTDQAHGLVERGPYAFVRHPGYVGFTAILLPTPLLLASAWSTVPLLLFVVAIVVRTWLEDRMLQEELPGYAEYVMRVRSRLVPGIW